MPKTITPSIAGRIPPSSVLYGPCLVGRDDESATLGALAANARNGRGGALVVRGHAGIGKSALLDSLAASSGRDMRILSCRGAEAEAGFAFAGLHQLLLPVQPTIGLLPRQQADALRSAFGLGTGECDRFLIALATLTLLSHHAQDTPLLVLVDDAQWLDVESAEVLSFVGRRLDAQRIAFVAAARDGERDAERFAEVAQLHVGPLSAAESETLLMRTARDAARPVLDRLLHEAGGNPLALTELPATLTRAELLAAGPLPDHLRLSRRLQDAFARHLRLLAPDARGLLLVAAAASDDDLSAIPATSSLLWGDRAALTEVERSGLVEQSAGGLRFRQPLTRSVVYACAAPAERREAHRALAEALNHRAARHAYHLGAATFGPDEQVAAKLAAAAERVRRTVGGSAAIAAFEQAAALAPSTDLAADCLVNAAIAAWQAGRPVHAGELLDRVGPLAAGRPAVVASVERIRALIAHASSSATASSAILLRGAQPIIDSTPDLAAEMLVMAARSAWFSGDLNGLLEVGRRLSELPLTPDRPEMRLSRQLLQLRDKEIEARATDASDEGADPCVWWLDRDDPRPWIWPPALVPQLFGKTDTVLIAYQEAVEMLRRRGDAGAIPMTVAPMMALQIHLGDWSRAVAEGSAALVVAEETGQSLIAVGLQAMLAWVAALRGHAEQCRKLVSTTLQSTMPRGLKLVSAHCQWVLGLLHLGEGNLREAIVQLMPILNIDDPAAHFAMGIVALPDLIEALVLAGDHDEGRRAFDMLDAWSAGSLPYLQARQLRCAALLADVDRADSLFQTAIHTATPSPFEAARTNLLYGEWLRRMRRVKDARLRLRTALRTFDALQAGPWITRAIGELRAAGDAPDPGDSPTESRAAELTPREAQIVQFAARGMTNAEIGTRLFLSPRTVGYHLHKIFTKLGITSRRQLCNRIVLDDLN
ncbi:helix-turn-helix transcriptional regulator [Mangrovihabitans endophyticus]|uniref:Transcriptional regulator n=1 Tax=Mangrovihabitans endophyticus TaxID=1751298 RepID=A0A8J3BXA0_9ACTN|nr:helix-turn-helix transcriptional regulator [Mangrovihabitans endophyticus]GGK78855.1 transcriptional regulator [Mangrovihabitans endophyticus]